MYNFGVPAQLKNWIDAISRAGVTFRYTGERSRGSAEGQARLRGAHPRRKIPEPPADTQVPYLETVFAFLGMTDVHFVYAEGLAMGPDSERTAIDSRVRADRGCGRRVTRTRKMRTGAPMFRS